MALLYVSSNNLPEEEFYVAFNFYIGAAYKFATEAFRFTPNKSHKVNRVLSLLMGRHIVKMALLNNRCIYSQTKAIHFRMSPKSNTIYVISLEPIGLDYVLMKETVSDGLFKMLSTSATFGNIRYIERFFSDLKVSNL